MNAPMLRPASKAGAWYSADAETLAAEVKRHTKTSSVNTANGRPIAGIVPHAGLAFSGDTAGVIYSHIAEAYPAVETFLVFGAVHTTHLTRPAIWTRGAWDTPLGAIEIDEPLADKLVAAGVGEAYHEPHVGDNSIELQTPFLKHLFPAARLVPVATPAAQGMEEIGAAAWAVVRASHTRVVVLGSTDLTHYGESFGFTPAGRGADALAWSKANDRRFLETLAAVEADALVTLAQREHSACGAGAAAATCGYAQAAGCEQGIILAQTTSADASATPDFNHFVGYGAVLFSLPK